MADESMTDRTGADESNARRPYATPVLRSYGNAAEVTRVVSMIGFSDGGPGSGSMSRTG